MTFRTALTATAAVTGALLLAACGPSAPAAHKAPASPTPTHPVYSKPLADRPYAALGRTKAAKNAAFTQTVTFSAKGGDAVLTTAGKLDFAANRADGSLGWNVARGFPDAAAKALGNIDTRERRTDQASRFVISPERIDYRAATARYWLRYDGADTFAFDPYGNEANTIKTRRGGEAAFGGTLLEVVSTVRDVEEEVLPGGARRYRAGLAAGAAYGLLHSSVIKDGLNGTDAHTRLPMTLTTDAAGRLTALETDLSPLFSKEADSVLSGVTGLRVKLTLGGYDASAPSGVPAGDKVLPAGESVVPLPKTEAGGCVDFGTGMPNWGFAVKVPCDQPHDARVFALRPLPRGDYPGQQSARLKARAECRSAYPAAPSAWRDEAVDPGSSWYRWPSRDSWDRGVRVVTCYVLSR
ncbi:septum formation family protein [Streptomyces sp. NPDC048111]|uniref:septum formation family protein n=1 Tax=Streptomyces sp. NPDC048111 TaxID=3365500 RepID=UPI0037121F8A